MRSSNEDLLAVEVGSSCIKLGWFSAALACTSEKPAGSVPIAGPRLPEPAALYRIEHRGREQCQWIAEAQVRLRELDLPAEACCAIASVHAAVAEELVHHCLASQFSHVDSVTAAQIPIEVRLKEPAHVGVDRLLSALAVNRLRQPDSPAIVADMGTATTVNLIAADGAFQGGAILAGPLTSLRALHQSTASLPLLDRDSLVEAPEVVGKSTSEAMASGAYWGAMGAVKELVRRITSGCSDQPEFFLTGGASSAFANVLGVNDQPVRYIPHLVLAGIKIAFDETRSP
jgi:type III pantothenate kinase